MGAFCTVMVGVVALVSGAWIIRGELREKHIARLKAQADANSLVVGRTINQHVRDTRASNKKGE